MLTRNFETNLLDPDPVYSSGNGNCLMHFDAVVSSNSACGLFDIIYDEPIIQKKIFSSTSC